jgi:hypothetical protein
VDDARTARDGDHEAFMSALVTEHLAQQGISSATINESSSRSSLYLLSLSSSLVALGFATQSAERLFVPFAAVVLPTLFLLGCFTVVRLVDTSIENVVALRRVAHIRRYYATLTPQAAEYFPSLGDDTADAQSMLGVRYDRWSLWFTMASMVGTINAVLGGAVTAVLLEGLLGVPRPVGVASGVVVAVALVAAVLRYQRQRFSISLGT